MNELLKQKMNAVLADLQNCHSSTQSWPSIITGLERELVISKILKLAIPNSYRIGKGVIIDSNNAQTGEVDIVIEVPLSPSFPITDGESRLYLAEGVGTTIEVKSDFRRQKKNAMEKNYEIKRLHRIPASSNNRNEIHAASYFYIPNYLIFYKGPRTIEGVIKLYDEHRERSGRWPNGILIIETGIFVSMSPAEVTAKGGASIYAFITHILDSLKQCEATSFDFMSYA